MTSKKRRAVRWAAGLSLMVIAMACFAFTALERHGKTLRLAEAVNRGERADEREVRALLASGADPNAPFGIQALTLTDALRVALRLKQPQESKQTIFLYAASHVNERVLRCLLEAGGDVRRHTPFGGTPLCLAVGSHLHRNVEMLVQHGADVNCYGQPHTPLSEVFSTFGFGKIPNSDDLAFLLAHGADPNGHDQYGITPLMWAGFRSSPETIGLLLQAHADLNARDTVGATPLIHAVISGNSTACAVFLKAGADPTLRDHQGRTAEEIAVAAGNKPLAALIQHYTLHRAKH